MTSTPAPHRGGTPISASLTDGVGTAMPVLRMLDVPSAHRFYLDHLGFTIEWEHASGGPPLVVTNPPANAQATR